MTMRVTGPERNDELIREAKALFKSIIEEDKRKKLDRLEASQRLLAISQKFLNAGAPRKARLPALCIPLDDVRDDAICDVIQALLQTKKKSNLSRAYETAGHCLTSRGEARAESLMRDPLHQGELLIQGRLGAGRPV